MNRAEIADPIEQDLRASPSGMVVYLEGKTDPAIFFALLGMVNPPDDVYQGVLVRGLDNSRGGGGSKAVKTRVELAPRSRRFTVVGVIDGDGRSIDELGPSFDADDSGPLFSWKAYCIENLLVKTGWPSAWGREPDWPTELAKYAPYIALNRVGSKVQGMLKDLGLARFSNPVLGESLRSAAEIVAALADGKAHILSLDVELEFQTELSGLQATIFRSLDEAHALINGKWLLRHLAPTLTGRDRSLCEFEWLAHARSVGGLLEVRDWWGRLTGNPPMKPPELKTP